MNPDFFVCPLNKKLIRTLRERSLVIKLDKIQDVGQAVALEKEFDFHIHCLQLETQTPLASIPFQNDWLDVPLAVYTPSLGNFFDFVEKLPLLRQINIRVYLPTNKKENYTNLQIISSLGITSALEFKKDYLDWELMTDLMTYALLPLVPHAPIDPFYYIANRYDPHKRNDYNSVYFNDFRFYLHLDHDGRVYFSHDDLKQGHYIADSIEELNNPEVEKELSKRYFRWTGFFLKTDGCAYCPGWRICLGKFSDTVKSIPGCSKFFSEFMDVIEQYKSIQRDKKEVWQP